MSHDEREGKKWSEVQTLHEGDTAEICAMGAPQIIYISASLVTKKDVTVEGKNRRLQATRHACGHASPAALRTIRVSPAAHAGGNPRPGPRHLRAPKNWLRSGMAEDIPAARFACRPPAVEQDRAHRIL
ncbi:hypothetical protein [Herbaspirillum sp. SJZ099]|uniref:hypothetical protein n=1 Tax=Herbaspirillum sp. SJZ099 TaxID=2572916 RepID=UPI0011A71385|nr:hypothetical protein [Herbaspirillum sp. SJZ099]